MPKVSVILPVYNAEKYLREAIDSILHQTFTDFELLLINDGSTDGSEKIIQSYTDNRIIYLKNENNKGLIFSLNRAIDLASGEYIARMDADDIALPERFEKQVAYLDTHINTGIVATVIAFIDESGKEIGVWDLDRKTLSADAIRKAMITECCLAHPTVMGRSELFKKFHYNETQIHIEDYDLWLRLLGNGIKISKIPLPLLNYRIHSKSVTQFNKKEIIPQKRIFDCKRRYLKQALTTQRISIFNMKVVLSMIPDFLVIVKKTLVG